MRRREQTVMVAADEQLVALAATRCLALWYRVAPPVIRLAELEPAIARHQPALLLLDIMWGSDSVLDRLPNLSPGRRVLRLCMFSAHHALPFISDAFASGASGYLLKPATVAELHAAAAAVLAGRRYLSAPLLAMPGVGECLERRTRRSRVISAAPVGSLEFERCAAWLVYAIGCTPAEARIILLSSTGCSAKQTAIRLGRTNATITTHFKELYPKVRPFGVTNLTSLGRLVGEMLAQMPRAWAPPGQGEPGQM